MQNGLVLLTHVASLYVCTQFPSICQASNRGGSQFEQSVTCHFPIS